MMTIFPGSTYGDPRKQASQETVHGLTAGTVEALGDRMEKFLPGLASKEGTASRQFFDGALPDGAELDPRIGKIANVPSGTGFAGGGFNQGGGTQVSMQRPYQPEFESPDRQQYPVHRILANRYWRLFFKLDPVIGTCTDMFSTMPWSDFQLTGEGVSGEIKDSFETMCQETQVLRILEYMVKEFLVIGEACPHCWTPHQEVLTSSGFKRIDNIKEGDLVLTHNNRTKKVTDIYTRGFSGNVLNFNVHKLSALPIQCTPEHPLYIYKDDGPEWIKASEVSIGDYVNLGIDKTEKDIENFDVTDIVPEYFDLEIENDKYGRKEQIKDIISVDNDFMRLVGYYYAEGSALITTRKGRLSFSFHIDEENYHNDVISIIKEKFGIEPQISLYESKHTKVIHINSKIITKFFLNLFGTGCRDKLIPDWLRVLPTEKQKHFVIGLFRGDGNIYTNKSSISTAQIQLAHKELTHLVWQMLLRMKVIASFNIFNRKKYGNYWKCGFNANNYSELAEEIFEIPISHKKPAHKRYKETLNGNIYFRIGGISEEEYLGSVWNLEVEDDHSYVVGGVVGHNCFFDDAKGIWTYTALHNPDQLEVIDAPFIKMDPVIEFIPDDRLRSVLTSNNHLLRKVREQMPSELISRLVARQNIPLSPINMTFIPRRLHPYDTRGTSIISRMWRILMYEDSVYNASIATARRHAGPIKVAKLGNPQTGWIPSQEHERRLLQLLSQAELDVNSWLVYHYGINFEMVGTTDRIMNINQHHDVIERIKLIAMGISKSFLHGEVTYASSVTGLSVFLQRLRAMRDYFVNVWLLPKFFKPIAKINGWSKRDKGELTHRYRIKRSQKEIEQENRWIVPKIEWQKTLDHTTNSELISAMQALEGMGIKFSKTTKYAAVGKKFEDEINKIAEEQVLENEIKQYVDTEPAPPEGGGVMPSMPGGKPMMPPPGGAQPPTGGPPKMPAPGGDAGVRPTPPRSPGGLPGAGALPSASPGGGPTGGSDKDADGGGTGPSGKKDPAVRDMNANVWDHKGRHGNWSASEIQDLITLLNEGYTESAFWEDLRGPALSKAINSGDPFEVLDIIEEYLEDRGHPSSDARQLRRILDEEGILKNISTGDSALIKEVESKIPNDIGMLDDEDAMNRLSSYIKGERPSSVKVSDPDALFIGHGNVNWSGDISDKIEK
jgi:intein/homing endonuclease